MSRADNFVKNGQNLPISNPKAELHNINAHIKFDKNPEIYTIYCPESKIKMYCGQITQLKIDKICPLAIQKKISTISMNISNLVKIQWYLLKLLSWK